MHSCQNNFEKSYTEKKTKHRPSGYSIFTICSFDPTKNKLNFYKGGDCMESFCKDLRAHAMKIMNYRKKEKKKEMIPLTYEENELYESKKFVTYAKKYLVLIKTIKIYLNYIIK